MCLLTCNHMVRTQIQLEKSQAAVLQKMATARKQSMAQLIRMSVDLFVKQESGAKNASRLGRAKSAVGKFSSTSSDGSRHHDQYLADAFAASSSE